MIRFHTAGFAALVSALFTNIAAAQSLPQSPVEAPRPLRVEVPASFEEAGNAQVSRSGRDSVVNGTLIGLGVGLGAAYATGKVFDALMCESSTGCSGAPWPAYALFGAIGAGAGAGIDLLIGRSTKPSRTAVRLAPVVGRRAKGLQASIKF